MDALVKAPVLSLQLAGKIAWGPHTVPVLPVILDSSLPRYIPCVTWLETEVRRYSSSRERIGSLDYSDSPFWLV